MSGEVITQTILDSINVESASRENYGRLEELGGVKEIALGLGVDLETGVEHGNIEALREKYGDNTFPESPISSFLEILIEALSDTVLLILIAAATTSIIVGVATEPEDGWIEGVAIFIAVGAVSTISAGNDYSKQLQFKALEAASAKDEKCGVLRDDRKDFIPVNQIVVGDILILQAGDQIPADCVIYDSTITAKTNEASLTGEADDLAKSFDKDPFLLSSCHVVDVEGQDCKAMVISVGRHSQWGKIKGNLVSDSVNTPLQDKLETMTQQIGYIGMIAAAGTFLAIVIRIWAEHNGNPTERQIVDGFVEAFIIAVTIVVVAIPEGLPLAVTISLAYSTKKMYKDNCFIRVLAACETMGNATNICSDKTGTLTENKMVVVEGWFADKYYNKDDFTIVEKMDGGLDSNDVSRQNSIDSQSKKTWRNGVQKFGSILSTSPLDILSGSADKDKDKDKDDSGSTSNNSNNNNNNDNNDNNNNTKVYTTTYKAPDLPTDIRHLITEQVCCNRTAYLLFFDAIGNKLDTPGVIGSKTEGALLLLSKAWGFDPDHVKAATFVDGKDKLFSFNSVKKRSTCIVKRPDGSIRLFCKGASEQIIQDCSFYTTNNGNVKPMTTKKLYELNNTLSKMADRALRTLVLAHVDFPNEESLPLNWKDDPPDNSGLCCDAMVGIMDPLRSDVTQAVKTAQNAGVTVRMVTGDNIQTAMAIAKDCGILHPNGLAIEGPVFRKMSPKDVDSMLPTLQVMARSSPDDKHLLVTRLNGHAIPDNQEEWEKKFAYKIQEYGITWDSHRDRMLPGYKEEWNQSRPEGGQVVGVTGDGTNDAPALKAADVGLAMGITGTKVAQGAADIVILDDRFSSIVRAMMWGRSVYDNIRKFLQFQLTVNVVACLLVFLGAAMGQHPPLNAVQMLWVNLVMDTLGALALGTEPPIPALLQRKPYKRSASLISTPMRRNILFQSVYQLGLLLFLMNSPETFNVKPGVGCYAYESRGTSIGYWDLTNKPYIKLSSTNSNSNSEIKCGDHYLYCKKDKNLNNGYSKECLYSHDHTHINNNNIIFKFDDISEYIDICLKCNKNDYTHGSLLFNTFIWCQIWNEYSSRVLFNEVNFFHNIFENYMFFFVSLFTIGAQICLIEYGGDFMKTSSMSIRLWLITLALGSGTIPVGICMRLFFPVEEDKNSFFQSEKLGIMTEKTKELTRGSSKSLTGSGKSSPNKITSDSNSNFDFTETEMTELDEKAEMNMNMTISSSVSPQKERNGNGTGIGLGDNKVVPV